MPLRLTQAKNVTQREQQATTEQEEVEWIGERCSAKDSFLCEHSPKCIHCRHRCKVRDVKTEEVPKWMEDNHKRSRPTDRHTFGEEEVENGEVEAAASE